MLLVLLLFALTRTLHGVPLSSPMEASTGFPTLDRRNTQVQFGEREVNDIIISCFATIFACTWSAVHPNIPAPTDCWWTRFKRQVTTMIYALLAPEAITAWALRQRLAARKIADEFNDEIATKARIDTETHSNPKTHSAVGVVRRLFQDSPVPSALEKGEVPPWTLTHGFFLQMGGFMLSEDGRPSQILTTWTTASNEVNIIWNIQKGIIDAPTVLEEDLKDRSKGDAISKTLIILQTTWFIVQCLARWSNHLPVTELEVVTLGFAMLNGITYGLWWSKPQNVGRPICLPKKPQIQSKKPRFERKRRRAVMGKPGLQEHNLNPRAAGHKSPPEVIDSSPDAEKPLRENPQTQLGPHQGLKQRDTSPNPLDNVNNSDKATENNTTKTDPRQVSAAPVTGNGKKSWLGSNLRRDIKQRSSSAPWQLLGLIPLRCASAFLRPLAKLAEYGEHRVIHFDDLRVAMFDSGFAGDSEVFIPTAAIGALFGAVHLISSWFLNFSSDEERWLWRVSAVVITIGPMVLGLWRYFYFSHWESILGICMLIGVPLYIISRIVLLTLSLISLRNLPHDALQTVEWTTFIPHL